MVTTTETTEIVTKPKLDEVVQPSFKRWLKHLLHMPASKRFFNQQDQHAIAQSVAAAEQGHVGEIQVVIEGHMPAREAYYLDTRGRAKQLFAELGVWDTELNSGVLLYLNLCEQKVEIVIDRGIQKATEQVVWDQICQNIIQQLAAQHYKVAVIKGVESIGEVLIEFYAHATTDRQNELSNDPIILG
ncbi:TPM domain-containing protein [Acinetobacter johnsonii]|uniref:Domain of uncharacterized function (DUF477) n=1 Tax=Acinetobacter johnsonii TaxID=40214 RepID=A0A380U744_ACIJO|nr:TPM domain-containing protein [Acinetobacter johnsonii]ENU38186.1 hypothetical protein F986_03301 [Acinetobacter johnsonii CIP 64.6]QPS04157.1 TPM domain-containing protein [Acinetobacter johnsonii]SUT97666.1 Domain of uncharacterised function (DUF477) [Acinetobacter johnsonii]